MANEFTAVVERDGDWFVAYSPEIPGANGQARNKQEALDNLSAAISLILEDRRKEIANNLAKKICRALSVPEIGTKLHHVAKV